MPAPKEISNEKDSVAPPSTPKQQEDLRNLKIARAIVLRKVTDPDLNRILQGVPRENGKYRTYYGVFLRDIFQSLANTFDPNFKQALKTSYTKDELKEYLEHFEQSAPGFETHLDNAIEALERGEAPTEPHKKNSQETDRGDHGKEKEEQREKKHEGKNELPEPIEEEGTQEKGEIPEEKPAKTPEAKIIEIPLTGPSRGQRLRDFGAKIPLGRISGRLLSPILRKINPILERNKEILIPTVAGAVLGAATGGAPTAVLYGIFGGAMGAGVIKPIVQGGSYTGGVPEPSSNGTPQEKTSPQETPPLQENGPNSPDNNTPQRRTPLPPPTPGSSVIAETARLAMSFPGRRTWLILGLIGLAIVIWITMSVAGGNGGLGSSGSAPAPSPSANTSAQVNVTKAQQDCKSEKDYCVVTNGSDITYIITVTYLGQGAATVEVDDPLPPETTLKNAPGGDNQGGTIKWVLNNMTPNQPKRLTLTLTPGNDVWVVNKATATVLLGGNQAPNNNTCGEKYTLTNHESGAKNPLGNFGDPSCNYTQQQLYEQLKQNDPANADFWFNAVVKCESGYDPTDWRDPSLIPHTPDTHGAFGLFQMGMGDSSNGPLDNGAVNWPLQVTNAVGYKNQKLGGNFGYWACAK